ncbi:MAG: hypothetical protein ACI4MA_05525 [Treponema sp.]
MKKRIKVNIRKENNENGSVDITGFINGEIRFNGEIIATVVDGEIKNYPLAGVVLKSINNISKKQGEKYNLEKRNIGIMNQKSDSRTRNKKSFIDTKVGNPL